MSDFEFKAGDTAQPFIYPPQFSDATIPNFAGATLRCKMRLSGATALKIDAVGTIDTSDPVRPLFKYTRTPADADTAGTYDLEFKVTYANATTERWPTEGFLSVQVFANLGGV